MFGWIGHSGCPWCWYRWYRWRYRCRWCWSCETDRFRVAQCQRCCILHRSNDRRYCGCTVALMRTRLIDRYRVQLVLSANILVSMTETQWIELLRVLLLTSSWFQGVVFKHRRIAPRYVIDVVMGPEVASGRLVTGTAVAEAHRSARRPWGTRRCRSGMMQRAMQSRNSGKLRSNQLKQNAASGHSHTGFSQGPSSRRLRPDSVLTSWTTFDYYQRALTTVLHCWR